MLKPSRETLRLQRERDKVEKELQDFTYSHPKWNEYDHETNLPDVELTLNEPLSKKEKMLKEIQIMRTEYLKNGGKDQKVLSELYQMERELIETDEDHGKDSHQNETQSIEYNTPGNLIPDKSSLPLQLSHSFHANPTSNITKLEREIQEIDLHKDKLIAQRELKILEIDLKEEERAMMPQIASPKSATVIEYPLTYIPRHGFQICITCLEGWRRFKPESIQFIAALFHGSTPLQKFTAYTWIPNHQYDETDKNNQINFSTLYQHIPAKLGTRMVIDIRFTIGKRKDVSFSWTSFDLFKENSLDVGTWKGGLYSHPIQFDISPYAMKKSMTMIPSSSFYYRILDGSTDVKANDIIVPDDFQVKESINNDQATQNSYDTSLSQPIQQLRPTLKKFKKDVKEHEQILTLNQQPTMNVKEKVIRDVNAKKFAIGFQLNELTGFPGLDGDTIIRLAILDVMPDNRIVAFTSSKPEPGEVDGTYGWQYGYLHEIGSITGISKRKGLFEIVNKGVVVGSCPIDIFKFSSSEAYDICDGVFNLPVTPSKSFSETTPILKLRLFKPKFGQPPIQKFTPKLITPPVPEEAFSFIPAQPPVPVELKKMISISILIDSIRFLPTNVTVPKLYARIYSKRKEAFIKGVDFSNSISLENTVYNPIIQLAKEIPAKLLDSSCILILEIHTMEYFTRSMELVGSALFQLFGNNDSKEVEIKINYGAFQIPIFYFKIDRDFLRNSGNIQKYFRVPCATILMRVVEKDLKGKIPDYQDRIYQTMPNDIPTEYEALIYSFVFNERKEFSIRDRLLSLGEALPKTARHTDDSLVTWLSKKIENDSRDPLKIRMIDLSFITTYNPYYGFKLSIDSATNLTHKAVTFAVVSFTPSYYILGERPTGTKFPDDAMYTKLIDFQSSTRNPKWNDGYHWYRFRQSDRDLLAIIQLLGISVNQSSEQVNVISQGWTLLPIFASDLFVRHGQFKLPLFEGYATNEALSRCWKEGEFELDEGIHSKAMRFTPKYASINVRLCDGRRAGELDPLVSSCSEEFLGTFNAKFQSSTSSSDVLSSLKYRKQTISDFEKQMTAAFIEATNLPYIP